MRHLELHIHATSFPLSDVRGDALKDWATTIPIFESTILAPLQPSTRILDVNQHVTDLENDSSARRGNPGFTHSDARF